MAGPEPEERHFQLLLLDYEMARDDERTFTNVQVAVASVAAALLAILAVLVSDACQLRPGDGCKEIPNTFLAVAPAMPLCALVLMHIFGMVASVRSYYTRAIERELRKYAVLPLSALGDKHPIWPASYSELITEITSMRRGHRTKLLYSLILLVTITVFGGLALYIALQLGGVYRTLMIVVYGTASLFLLAEAIGTSLGGHTAFSKVAEGFCRNRELLLSPGKSISAPRGRSLNSYLFLPRPEDWSKWLFVPLVFLVFSLVEGEGFEWNRLLLTLLVVEYLLYSARYQWNDVRGFADDTEHPEAAARLRLPHGVDARQRRLIVKASLYTALARVALALLVGYLAHQLVAVLVVTVLITGAAVLYEYLKDAAADSSEIIRTRAARSLWFFIGSGYLLRFLAGVHASNADLNQPAVWFGAVFAWAFGCMFVLLTWVLEATAFCRRVSGGEWRSSGRLLSKPHLRLLLPYAVNHRISVERGPDPEEGKGYCGAVPVLRERGAFLAPWNYAYWCVSIFGGLLALSLFASERGLLPAAVVPALYTSGAVLVSLALRPAVRMMVFLAFTAGLTVLGLAVFWWSGSGLSLGLSLPWLVGSGVYVFFREQSYRDLKSFLPQAAVLLKAGAERAVMVIVGNRTWNSLR